MEELTNNKDLITSEGYVAKKIDSFYNNKDLVNIYTLDSCKTYSNVIVTSIKTGEIDKVLYPDAPDYMKTAIIKDIKLLDKEEYFYVHDVLYDKLCHSKKEDFIRAEVDYTNNYVLTVYIILFAHEYTVCVHKNRGIYIIGSCIDFNRTDANHIADHLFDIFNINAKDFIK